MDGFLQALKVQRWDDHRYYHHSRINQALHLVSALSFVSAYVLIFTDPVAAALLGWLVAMTSRQIGHFSLIRFAKAGAATGTAAVPADRFEARASG